MLERLSERGFEICFQSHAAAILEKDFPNAVEQLEAILLAVRVPILEIIGSGGGETKGTQRMRHAFSDSGWRKGRFEIRKTINGVESESTSHEVDHVQQVNGKTLALEIEWNKVEQ